jgi:hypothetical protein
VARALRRPGQWHALNGRIAAGLIADGVALKTDFENTGVLEEVGSTKYLVQLLSCNVGWMTTPG